DQRLFPPVAFLDSIKGACIVNVRGKQLWSETDVILWRGAKSLGPKLAEVLYIERAIYNRHLNAAWIGDSAMEETNALQHRTDERKLLLKPAVHHLLPGVPVREIAIEAHFGKPLDELHGPPHVLADGRAMRFRCRAENEIVQRPRECSRSAARLRHRLRAPNPRATSRTHSCLPQTSRRVAPLLQACSRARLRQRLTPARGTFATVRT